MFTRILVFPWKFPRRHWPALLACLVALAPGLARAQDPGAAALPAGISADFARECARRLPPAAFRISVPVGEIRLVTTLPVSALDARAAQGDAIHEPGGYTLGLTESRYQYQTGVDTPVQMDAQTGLGCARAGFDITVLTGPQTIYVGEEFPPGTCAYQEILAHETRHAQTNQAGAQRAAQALAQAMRAYYGEQVLYGTRETLQMQFQEDMEQRWLPFLDRETRMVHAWHAQIDSIEETIRMRNVCDGAIRRQLRLPAP